MNKIDFKWFKGRYFPKLMYALYLYKREQYEQAKIILIKLVKQYPNNPYLQFKCGMCYYKQGNWSDALPYMEKACVLNPTQHEWKVRLNKTELNVIKNKKVKNCKGKKSVRSNIVLSDVVNLISARKYLLAQQQLESYLKTAPNSEYAFKLRGAVAEKMRNYGEAIEYFSKAYELSLKTNLDTYYRIGFNFEQQGNIAEAEKYYHHVLQKTQDENVKKFGIGVLHAQRGIWDFALVAYQKWAIFTKSQDAELFYRMGVASSRLYKWQNAAEYFEKSIELSPIINAHTCFKCAESYERAKNLTKAVEYYQESVKRTSDYQDYWFYRLGVVLSNIGNYKLACDYFQQSRRYKLPYGIAPKLVVKSKEEQFLTYYTEYYETLPLDDKQILFESFLGLDITCNPYAILSYMLKHNYEFTYIVVIAKETVAIPDNLKFNRRVIFIRRNSDAYLRYLATAKYLVNNTTFPYWFIRKENQVYLNTWHGTPTKTLGKDVKTSFMEHANSARNLLQATHIISPNRFTSDILLDKHDIRDIFGGKIAETGYPRVDLTLNLTDERKKEIADRMGISFDKPIVFYAPTWRSSDVAEQTVQRISHDLSILNSDKYYFIFRAHHLLECSVQGKNWSNIIIPPSDIVTNELLSLSDILITDYSSVVYDYLQLNKPVITYCYDYDVYKESRGLYLQQSDLVGEIVITVEELKNKILNYKQLSVNNQLIKDKFSYLDDGSATERVINFMLNEDDTYLYHYPKRKADLFFEGSFIPNGVCSSFLNLSNMMLTDTKANVLVFDKNNVLEDVNRCNQLSKMPSGFALFARIGRLPMTVEELWLRNKYEEMHCLYSSEFKERILNMYKREARRLFSDSQFNNVVNFDGYGLFWVLLLSQINAKQHVIWQHSDMYREYSLRFNYLKAVFDIYSFYDKYVSVSQYLMQENIKKLSSEFHIKEEKFTYINNVINAENVIKLSFADITLDKRYAKFSGIKFVALGRLSPEKGYGKLINAFAQLKLTTKENICLYIIGGGILEEELDTQVKSLNLQDSVFLLGLQENPYPYLREADCFVSSSDYEGSPMVILEALVLNKPIIATDIMGNRSVLQKKYGILVENSVDGLANGMRDFLANKYQDYVFDYQNYNHMTKQEYISILGE